MEIDRSDEEIAEVVEATSFRKMSQAGNDGRISALTRKGIQQMISALYNLRIQVGSLRTVYGM